MATINFGLTHAFIRRGVQGIPASVGLYITIFLGIPLLVIASAVTGQLFHLDDLALRSYILLGVAGVTQFLIGRYALFRCLASIGANRATPVRSLSVPFTLLMAVFVLGEKVSMINCIGIVIVVLSPMLMFRRKVGTDVVDTSRSLQGYLYGLLTALAFGCSPLFIRGAIGDTGMGVAGALIAYGAAAVPLLFGIVLPGRLASLQGMDRTALLWFLLNTVTVFLAQMFSFLALDVAQVTVVEPLMCTTGIWAAIFAFLINRRLEAFGPNVLAAIALSIGGSVFVVL